MTADQTLRLAVLAKQLLPKTTDEQAVLLREQLGRFEDFDLAKRLVKEQALAHGDEPRLNVGAIVQRMVATCADGHAMEREREALARRQREREDAARRVAQDNAAALAFCRSLDPTTLEQMAAEVLSGNAFVASAQKRHPRPTLESTALVSLIYERFAGKETRNPPPNRGTAA